MKHPIIYYIDAILLTILIITVLYAQAKGKYIDKEIITIETCNYEPTTNGIKTLEELGWKPQNQTTQQQTTYNNKSTKQTKS